MDDKKKVLRVIARLNIGGPALHTILLTHFLDEEFDTKLVVGDVSRGEETMDYLLGQYQVTPLYLNTLRRELSAAGDVRSVLSLYKLIREFQPDVVHTHTAKAGAVGRSAVILYNLIHLRFGKKRIRIIHTFHGHVFNGYFSGLVTAAFLWIERILALFTDRIIAVSDTLKQELAERYRIAPERKIKAIYNGYDLKPFLALEQPQSGMRAQPHRADHAVTLTIVGRLVPIKGHKFLLQAFGGLRFPARLMIVGDGLLKDELVQRAEELGIRNSVEFLGYRKDVVPVYRDTDIFVLSSLNEGAPVAVIEALACALPVIATDVGGVKDLLGSVVKPLAEGVYLCERGILAPPGQAGALAAAVDYLVNHPEIGYETGMRGRKFVSTLFTLDRLVRDMKKLYNEVLN